MPRRAFGHVLDFLVLGAGCIGFIIKMIMEWYFGRTL
ncbi:DUF2788 domain-containing protein [Faucicola atlantae]